MADLAQIDLKTKGSEARLRALLEDLIDYYKGVYPTQRLALAVWFGKAAQSADQNLLVLFAGSPLKRIVLSERQSLAWKTGLDEPPFVNIYATSVEYFAEQLGASPQSLSAFFDHCEVLYFDKQALNSQDILRAFNVVTEPSGLIKGWYITGSEYGRAPTVRSLLAAHGHIRPPLGIVKIWESPDFETCRALMHAEFTQRWLPISEGGLPAHTYYNDFQDGRPGYLLLQGGSLYKLVKFEIRTSPKYSDLVLDGLPDGRYPEVYLRAVQSRQEPAA